MPGDGFNTGTAAFCNLACTRAVSELVRLHRDCPSAPNLDTYRRIQTQQYECNPPTAQCQTALFNYLYWGATAGQSCITRLRQRLNASLSSSDRQAAYAGFCMGTCGPAVQGLIDAMAAAGCRSWPAYLLRKIEYEQACLQVNGEYCEPSYLAIATTDTLGSLLDPSGSAAARIGNLSSLCTSCLSSVLALRSKYTALLQWDTAESELCMAELNPTAYCLPLYDEVINSVAARTDLTVPGRLNLLGQGMCDPARRRCVTRLWAQRQHTYTTSASDKTLFENYLTNLCTISTGVVPETPCALMPEIRDIANGFYLQSSTSFNCTPTDISGNCTNPTYCGGSVVGNWRFGCPGVCAQTLASQLFGRTGCCIRSSRTFYEQFAGSSAGDLFRRLDFLSSACSAAINSPCSPYNTKSVLVIDVPVPSAWAATAGQALQDAFLTDIADILGVTTSAISITSTSAASVAGNTRVTLTLGTQTSTEASAIRTSLTTNTAAGTLTFRASTALYDIRCQPGVNDGCSSALGLTASLLLFALLTFFSVLS